MEAAGAVIEPVRRAVAGWELAGVVAAAVDGETFCRRRGPSPLTITAFTHKTRHSNSHSRGGR